MLVTACVFVLIVVCISATALCALFILDAIYRDSSS